MNFGPAPTPEQAAAVDAFVTANEQWHNYEEYARLVRAVRAHQAFALGINPSRLATLASQHPEGRRLSRTVTHRLFQLELPEELTHAIANHEPIEF